MKNIHGSTAFTFKQRKEAKNLCGRRCVPKDTTPTLFAFGELYCYAVIFGLRPSYIRFASLERIEYP